MKNWVEWHEAYRDPESALSARLACVRAHLARALDEAPSGEVRLLSLCAGQGHDVLGVLPWHPRRDEVRAVLVEFNPQNARVAADHAATEGLSRVEVRQADAARVANYADDLPVHVLLLCGIFGNITPEDISRTVAAAPALCEREATVIWTRHRRSPDLTPRIREWFKEAGFDEVAFDALDGPNMTGVGVGRLTRVVPRRTPLEVLFTFQPG